MTLHYAQDHELTDLQKARLRVLETLPVTDYAMPSTIAGHCSVWKFEPTTGETHLVCGHCQKPLEYQPDEKALARGKTPFGIWNDSELSDEEMADKAYRTQVAHRESCNRRWCRNGYWSGRDLLFVR